MLGTDTGSSRGAQRLVGAASGVSSASSLAAGGRSERSRLLVMGLVGAERGVSSAGLATGAQQEESRLLVLRLVGAARGV